MESLGKEMWNALIGWRTAKCEQLRWLVRNDDDDVIARWPRNQRNKAKVYWLTLVAAGWNFDSLKSVAPYRLWYVCYHCHHHRAFLLFHQQYGERALSPLVLSFSPPPCVVSCTTQSQTYCTRSRRRRSTSEMPISFFLSFSDDCVNERYGSNWRPWMRMLWCLTPAISCLILGPPNHTSAFRFSKWRLMAALAALLHHLIEYSSRTVKRRFNEMTPTCSLTSPHLGSFFLRAFPYQEIPK